MQIEKCTGFNPQLGPSLLQPNSISDCRVLERLRKRTQFQKSDYKVYIERLHKRIQLLESSELVEKILSGLKLKTIPVVLGSLFSDLLQEPLPIKIESSIWKIRAALINYAIGPHAGDNKEIRSRFREEIDQMILDLRELRKQNLFKALWKRENMSFVGEALNLSDADRGVFFTGIIERCDGDENKKTFVMKDRSKCVISFQDSEINFFSKVLRASFFRCLITGVIKDQDRFFIESDGKIVINGEYQLLVPGQEKADCYSLEIRNINLGNVYVLKFTNFESDFADVKIKIGAFEFGLEDFEREFIVKKEEEQPIKGINFSNVCKYVSFQIAGSSNRQNVGVEVDQSIVERNVLAQKMELINRAIELEATTKDRDIVLVIGESNSDKAKVINSLAASTSNLIDCPNVYHPSSEESVLIENLMIDRAISKAKSIKAVLIAVSADDFFIDQGARVLTLIEHVRDRFPQAFDPSYYERNSRFFLCITKGVLRSFNTVEELSKLIEVYENAADVERAQELELGDIFSYRLLQSRWKIWNSLKSMCNGRAILCNGSEEGINFNHSDEALEPKTYHKKVWEKDLIRQRFLAFVRSAAQIWDSQFFGPYLSVLSKIEKWEQSILELEDLIKKLRDSEWDLGEVLHLLNGFQNNLHCHLDNLRTNLHVIDKDIKMRKATKAKLLEEIAGLGAGNIDKVIYEKKYTAEMEVTICDFDQRERLRELGEGKNIVGKNLRTILLGTFDGCTRPLFIIEKEFQLAPSDPNAIFSFEQKRVGGGYSSKLEGEGYELRKIKVFPGGKKIAYEFLMKYIKGGPIPSVKITHSIPNQVIRDQKNAEIAHLEEVIGNLEKKRVLLLKDMECEKEREYLNSAILENRNMLENERTTRLKLEEKLSSTRKSYQDEIRIKGELATFIKDFIKERKRELEIFYDFAALNIVKQPEDPNDPLRRFVKMCDRLKSTNFNN